MKQPSFRLHEKARVMRGFTLIELMVTAAIIVVLASIAVPSYTAYIVRSNRAVAHSEMMDIANRQQQYLLANRTYATQAQLNYALPSKLVGKYTPNIDPQPGSATQGPTFTITFSPVPGSTQARDGNLTLNQDGIKGGTW